MGFCGMLIVYIIEICVVLMIKKICKIILVIVGMKIVFFLEEDIFIEYVILVLIVFFFFLFKYKVIFYFNMWKVCCY